MTKHKQKEFLSTVKGEGGGGRSRFTLVPIPK